MKEGTMSLSRSPSPRLDGGWSTPGLTTPYESLSRQPSPSKFANGSGQGVTWTSAQMKSAKVTSYPSISSQESTSLFRRGLRKLSVSLPQFANDRKSSKQEKVDARGQMLLQQGSWRSFAKTLGRKLWRLRLQSTVVLGIITLVLLFYVTPLHRIYRGASFLGGGSNFVIILATNQGGGVMEWKSARLWAIERHSVRNKRDYAKKWGYHLELVDMMTKKRYAHEWRESWEKVDLIRNTMRKYPQAEWFWWLDLNTFIMEPTYSLQNHIFDNLQANTYRDINHLNPLNITHPPTENYLDPISKSPVGDGNPESIKLVIPQDCGGFSLGSFFIRRSEYIDRLFDVWWDPVAYEQMHMQWEHMEQDALEFMYRNQPWVRSNLAFIDQRRVNSFPPGACGEKGNNPQIHYHEQDRDFVVNMAGCQWGRDCWGEMHRYEQISERLNRNPWERLKDWVSRLWK